MVLILPCRACRANNPPPGKSRSTANQLPVFKPLQRGRAGKGSEEKVQGFHRNVNLPLCRASHENLQTEIMHYYFGKTENTELRW